MTEQPLQILQKIFLMIKQKNLSTVKFTIIPFDQKNADENYVWFLC